MTLDESDKKRIAGRKWAEDTIEYAIDQGPDFLKGFSRAIREFQPEPEPKSKPKQKPSDTMTFDFDDADEDIKTAEELIEQITSLAEELPENAEDFAMSVLDTASDISKYIDENGRVTKKQITALENMLDGLQRWIRD